MGFFTAPQRALALGRTVIYEELARLDFRSGAPGFYWTGCGSITIDGDLYVGAGNLVTRGEIPFGVDDEAGDLSITLSGVDATIVQKVLAEEAEIYGQPITLFGQFFDESLQPSAGKFLLFQGTMDAPTYAAASYGERAISIPCEGEWTDRNDARYSLFSDKDQKARFAGDRGLEYVYRITHGLRRRWPSY